MSVHKQHRKRVKEKFLQTGKLPIHQHEILELMLFYSIPQGDTNPIAHNLIKAFGSLSKVLDAPFEDLLEVDGVGEHTAVFLKALPQFFKAYEEHKPKASVLLTTEQTGEYMMPKFIGKTIETVCILALDNKFSPISCQEMFEGTVNVAPVQIRKIIEFCIKTNASAIVLAHNHPDGNAIPSNADIILTKKIMSALSLIQVTFVDHLVFADNDFVSLKESGYI